MNDKSSMAHLTFLLCSNIVKVNNLPIIQHKKKPVNLTFYLITENFPLRNQLLYINQITHYKVSLKTLNYFYVQFQYFGNTF